jgi:alpha-beta hydrolase superfamily lysophospholipase
VLAIPGLVEVLASREPLMYTMGQHYAAAWIPYVLVAFALGGAALLTSMRGRRWVASSAALSAIILTFFSPLHLGHFLRWPQPRDAATARLIAKIPQTASIGTYDEIYAHLGFYPHAAVGLSRQPQYVLMDQRYSSMTWDSRILPLLRRDVARGVYRPVSSKDGVMLLERR